ncbi:MULTISPECIES: hypothetical protein [Ferrimonas]|uniref:hypothetical protein n=1 Tax=Ferrimonas TaxID=44011 RepID=UPI00040EFA32|nr:MULTISPECIES: hypothetical protein [Ferrimonas]USD36194.1 hypothetical protein J8Z22_14260 [Ferrimonas sp. SCSIO 43195]
MSANRVLQLHSLIYGVFAVLLALIPAWLWPQYGLMIDDKYSVFLSQHNSIFLAGIAIIGWQFSRFEPGSSAVLTLLRSLIWTNLIGAAVTLYACLTGLFSGFGWSDPLFFIGVVLWLSWALKRAERG